MTLDSPSAFNNAKAVQTACQALADARNWGGVLALLHPLPDRLVQGRSLLLLADAALRQQDEPALRRAIELGAGLPPHLLLGLLRRLLGAGSWAAPAMPAIWALLRDTPALFAPEEKQRDEAMTVLVALLTRLPEGPEREAAAALLAEQRDSHADAPGLARLERREALLGLARQGDWPALCQGLAALPEEEWVAPLLVPAVTAALEQGDTALLARATALAATDRLESQSRMDLARRLAVGGRVEEGWALLQIDASQADAPASNHRLQWALSGIVQAAGPDSPIGRQAVAWRHSLVRPTLAPGPAWRLPAPPAPPTPLPPPGPLTMPTILAAPGLAPERAAPYRRLAEEFTAPGRHFPKPEVQVFENVYVNRSGQLWDAEGRMGITHSAALPPESLAAMAEAPFVPEAVLACTPTRGFFHWYVEHFPALAWRLQPGGPDLPLLFGSQAAGFQREMLGLLLDAPPPVITVGDATRIGRVLVPKAGLSRLRHWENYAWLYGQLVRRALEQAPQALAGPLLYLSRRDAPGRRMENEAAVEQALAGLGFTIVTFTGRPLAEQIAMVHQARIFAGPHGAGLSHAVTGQPGMRLFEIMPAEAGAEPLRSVFARLSSLRGHAHTMWVEPVNRVTRAWSTDIQAMLPALQQEMRLAGF